MGLMVRIQWLQGVQSASENDANVTINLDIVFSKKKKKIMSEFERERFWIYLLLKLFTI